MKNFKEDQDYINQINRLRKERNAVILVHNYQRPEIQDLADYLGDSLGLSRQAAGTDAEVIVFCGVSFMAESAAILSPDKTVLLPDRQAGCPMADMITADELRKWKQEHPGVVVVCYVNSSAEVKAESDICCTSSNAIKVVRSIDPEKEILFVPDKYLASYAAYKTGRKITAWPGYCPTHLNLTARDIIEAKRKYPEAKVVVHPECDMEVIRLADEAMSTGGMGKYVAETSAAEIILGTEKGMAYRLRKDNPGKKIIIPTQKLICPNMKLTTLEKVAAALEKNRYQVTVNEDIRQKAFKALDRMLRI
ncbi:MAG: quinolinate synthase NadA [bacterium]